MSRVVHSEVVEIRDLMPSGNGILWGTMEILGTNMHVVCLRVKDEEGVQNADGDEEAESRFEDLCNLDPNGAFCTTKLDGYEGEWVVSVSPFHR